MHNQLQARRLAELRSILRKRIDSAALYLQRLPECPDISLHLLDEHYPQWQLTNSQAAALMDSPPYWSFCWASGQSLASYIKSNPQLVAGKRLMDFGAGSGVVAIAALQAGAHSAIACDNDPQALKACVCNAAENGVSLETIDHFNQLDADVDIITAADVFYDRDNLPLLKELQDRSEVVLVADSRLGGKPLPGMKAVAARTSHTVPDLDESSEFRKITIYATDHGT